VWHASGRGNRGQSSAQIALNALRGTGDASRGEWLESGPRGIIHIRRRLSASEQEIFGIPEVRDIRGTEEERERFTALIAAAPHLRPLLAMLE